MNTNNKVVEEYINSFSAEVQERLVLMRNAIVQTAPNAIEGISYGMPAYKTNGKPLVYFAAFKNHIGFYATPNGHKKFATQLSKYKQGKGSVQFPFTEPLPLDLIKKIVAFKLAENANKK